MFTYTMRNLRSMFIKQRLLAFLLILNIVVSCLVICFSYGLYQNYNVIVQKGEEEEIEFLDIRISKEDTYIYEDLQEETADIDPQVFIDFAYMLSADTKANIRSIRLRYLIETPLCYIYDPVFNEEVWNVDPEVVGYDYYPEPYIYKDDADTAYADVDVYFKPQGDSKIVDAYIKEDTFDDDRYNNGDKIVVLGARFFDTMGMSGSENNKYRYEYRKLTHDETSVIIGGERYEIVNALDFEKGEIDVEDIIAIPLKAVPDGAVLSMVHLGGSYLGVAGQQSTCFMIHFNEPLTGEQYTDIKNCIEEASGGKLFAQSLTFTEAVEIYYYKTIMLVAIIIAILAAINMAILYRYILEKRSSELAIFRICGCSKVKAIASYLLECMIINIPLFALTQFAYHKLIMPRFSKLFPYMSGAYSMRLYAAIFGIYIGASLFIMLIMIAFTIRKHSLVALKSAPRATSKFGIMKVFEVVQLSAVLSIMVLIVSVIVSRYELYLPFKEQFERRGYMVSATAYINTFSDFKDMIGDREYISTHEEERVYIDSDIYSDDYIEIISYSDEFLSYAPPLQDGIWLSDTDATYEKDGYIPAVVTSCEGRYKVGDIIEDDAYYLDENNAPYVYRHYKYKIIGVIKDNANIASYVSGFRAADEYRYDYRDIYMTFNDEFDDHDYLLVKHSDEKACAIAGYAKLEETEGIHIEYREGFPYGTQFIFCEGMPDDEYEELGRRLERVFPGAASLETIRKNSLDYIYEQMYTLFPIAACIFILTIISTVSISAIYTKRQLRNYAIFYICGARWRTCALKSLKNGAITCAVSAALSASILIVGKATLLKETVISFGLWHLAVCAGVIVLYLALSMIMPLSIIGSSQPREVLKEE